ncbi:hypothetical protein MACJ_003396 [Theileria orientalis]|uniref:Uncharacterized protein n=1 Tax=Theileria orientalis TaxID=68886 RepID=A0A976SKC3_THEOR|nr:hypothetical protein MACJ_003396 [Theileria orientalis]
MYTFKTEKRK